MYTYLVIFLICISQHWPNLHVYKYIHNVVSHLGKKNIMFENNRLRRGRMFSRSPVGYSFWLNPITLQKIFKRNSGQFTWQGNHHHFRLVNKYRINHIYIVIIYIYMSYVYKYVYMHIHPTHINPRTVTLESKYMEFQPLVFLQGPIRWNPFWPVLQPERSHSTFAPITGARLGCFAKAAV